MDDGLPADLSMVLRRSRRTARVWGVVDLLKLVATARDSSCQLRAANGPRHKPLRQRPPLDPLHLLRELHELRCLRFEARADGELRVNVEP